LDFIRAEQKSLADYNWFGKAIYQLAKEIIFGNRG
jgi:hypothetical protein